MKFVHSDPWHPEFRAEIVDIQPLQAQKEPRWLALLRNGDLHELDTDQRSSQLICELPIDDLTETLGIHVSRDGKLCAVVERWGSRGKIFHVPSGHMAMGLDRGTYHFKHCEFPICFPELDGRTLVAHATKWNRLDVSDPETGELLTNRPSPAHEDPRYLDYFHCGLTLSPSHEWIADNGWMWHPVGIPRTWIMRRWLQQDVWESECGESVRKLCQRAYVWDAPICWIGDERLAVWGLGEFCEDEGDPTDGIRIFDVASGDELKQFPGVEVGAEDNLKKTGGWMAFDQQLFAISPQTGTAVWNIAEGKCLLHESGFHPLRYHRGARQFLSHSQHLVVSRLIT